MSKRTFLISELKAKQLGVSPQRIATLCRQDRFQGAVKAGRDWLIPEDEDPRMAIGYPKGRSRRKKK